MECINSHDGRWSISPCGCNRETIHFTYGNATLHILVEELRNLGIALQRMDEAIKSPGSGNGEINRSLH
ncbi:MAG: hypothetical protein ACREQP_09740 [Candidatus Binatia bacterium]